MGRYSPQKDESPKSSSMSCDCSNRVGGILEISAGRNKREGLVADNTFQHDSHSIRHGCGPMPASASLACALISSSTRTCSIVERTMVRSSDIAICVSRLRYGQAV